jgi:hypothetical protein
MTATAERAIAASSCTMAGVRPQREAWVSLIAGYCLCNGGLAVVWLPLDLLLSRDNLFTSFKFCFTLCDRNRPWGFLQLLSLCWPQLTYVLYLICGARLWFQRGSLKRSSLIVLLATLLQSAFHFLAGLESYFAYPSSHLLSFLFNSLALLWQIATPILIIWLVLRDMPDCDRWRPILATWLILMGMDALNRVIGAQFATWITAAPLSHPGWHTFSWDTLWPVNLGLHLMNAVIGITGGICLWRGSSNIRTWAWLFTTSLLLLRAVYVFMLFIVVGNSSFSGLPGTMNIKFSGFHAVKWNDWFGFVSVMVKTAAIAVPIIIFANNQVRRLQSESVSCRHCGYNLTGNTTGRCPECGNPTSRTEPDTNPA